MQNKLDKLEDTIGLTESDRALTSLFGSFRSVNRALHNGKSDETTTLKFAELTEQKMSIVAQVATILG